MSKIDTSAVILTIRFVADLVCHLKSLLLWSKESSNAFLLKLLTWLKRVSHLVNLARALHNPLVQQSAFSHSRAAFLVNIASVGPLSGWTKSFITLLKSYDKGNFCFHSFHFTIWPTQFTRGLLLKVFFFILVFPMWKASIGYFSCETGDCIASAARGM